MPVQVYGAGMAGLLTAAMLRRVRPIVYEAQPALPDNHGALLRFRTDAVERETGQLFRKVHVQKAVMRDGQLQGAASLRDANQYSLKVIGAVRGRSVLDLSPCVRYIAPPDFITGMARDAILKMESPLTLDALNALRGQTEVSAISTIPMPALMKMVGWEPPGFEWRPIWSVAVNIMNPITDVYQTVYYPEPKHPWYRASITGAHAILEYTADPGEAVEHHVNQVLADFGLGDQTSFEMTNAKRQEYGKLLPISDVQRQTFILAMTDEYNLYSIGRFATWRQILLDDVVDDVRHVERLITQRNAYTRRLEQKPA